MAITTTAARFPRERRPGRCAIGAACAAIILVTITTRCFANEEKAPAHFFPSASGFTLQQEPESIYAPPQPPREDEGLNEGGVHIDLTVRYMTDYVYRGIDFSEVGGAEDAP